MQNFDFNEALKAIQSGKPITGSDGVLAPLIKQLTEAALSAEIDSYLEQNPTGNRRNGYSKKTVKSAVGSFELETPRDRNGEFEPERGNSEASLRPSARRRLCLSDWLKSTKPNLRLRLITAFSLYSRMA
nr:transposase [Moraxella osloensis]